MMPKTPEMINSKQKRWLTGGAIFLLIFFVLYVLGELFPHTGLAAIIVIPIIILLNGLVIIVTIRITKNLQRLGYILSWITAAILTALITITLYPQEFRPNVFKQISYSFSAIRQFEAIPISDLDLPFLVDNFSRYDCTIKNSEERYIVALYKYRKTIPLDGSFHIYREEKTNIFSYYDTSIKNVSEIPEKFRTGQGKLIWWTLNKLGK